MKYIQILFLLTFSFSISSCKWGYTQKEHDEAKESQKLKATATLKTNIPSKLKIPTLSLVKFENPNVKIKSTEGFASTLLLKIENIELDGALEIFSDTSCTNPFDSSSIIKTQEGYYLLPVNLEDRHNTLFFSAKNKIMSEESVNYSDCSDPVFYTQKKFIQYDFSSPLSPIKEIETHRRNVTIKLSKHARSFEGYVGLKIATIEDAYNEKPNLIFKTDSDIVYEKLKFGTHYKYNLIFYDLDGHSSPLFSEDNSLNHPSFQSDTNPCLESYLYVAKNPQTGQNKDFCVMSTEAKLFAKNRVFTGQTNAPLAQSFRFEEAKSLCKMGLSPSFKQHLITNEEWMTIAAEIELNPKNWSSGVFGEGKINIGFSNGLFKTMKPIQATDSQYECIIPGPGYPLLAPCLTWTFHKRTHFLSTDEVIWDFSGNLQEWVDKKVEGPKAFSKLSREENQIFELNVLEESDEMPFVSFRPQIMSMENMNVKNGSLLGMGQYYPGKDETYSAFRRGGTWYSNAFTGIYALNLSEGPDFKTNDTGFRCTYLLDADLENIQVEE